jgi:ATP-binding cassette subfamily B protein
VVSRDVNSVQIIQAYTAEKTVERSFLNHMTAVYKAEHFYFYTRAILIAFAIFAILLAIATVLWIGNTHVTRGDISAGELGQFLLYALLSASAMSSLAESWSDILKAAGASERLWQILDTQSEVISSPDTESLSNSDAVLKNQILLEKISFKNVNFSYSCGKGLTYPAAVGFPKSILLKIVSENI